MMSNLIALKKERLTLAVLADVTAQVEKVTQLIARRRTPRPIALEVLEREIRGLLVVCSDKHPEQSAQLDVNPKQVLQQQRRM